MERTYKTWGEKYELFLNDLCEVNILYLRPKQRCSWHKHTTKFNKFFVVKGEIIIKNQYEDVPVKQGQVFTTVPGEYHEFQTTDFPAVVIEIMYVKYDPSDIQRETLGGPINE